MVKLYSTHCPKCNVLEKKLKDANIDFELVEKFDVKAMRDKGFYAAPILEIDGKLTDFANAVLWVNTHKG